MGKRNEVVYIRLASQNSFQVRPSHSFHLGFADTFQMFVLLLVHNPPHSPCRMEMFATKNDCLCVHGLHFCFANTVHGHAQLARGILEPDFAT